MGELAPTQSDSEQWNDDAHFTLANLPYGIASTPEITEPRIATRLQSKIYFLSELISRNLLPDLPVTITSAIHNQTSLNALAALPKTTTIVLRTALTQLLTSHANGTLCVSQSAELAQLSRPITTATLHLPLAISNFTDFSCSQHHVLNAGEAVLGVRSLPPGFPYFPVGYSGRTSSIAVSGTPVRRPWGMVRSLEQEGAVEYQPSKAVDFELEVAAVVGQGTKLGDRIDIANADESIFGFVLLNDWSARDIQGLEMNPLGPLNGKSFGTIISSWIIPLEALEPFRCAETDPLASKTRAPYLNDPHPKPHYAVQLEAHLLPASLPNTITTAASDSSPTTTATTATTFSHPPPQLAAPKGHILTHTSLSYLTYTFHDMLAHQTCNGCPVRTGDLLATGTVSGSQPGELGCLLEITRGGKEALHVVGRGGEGKGAQSQRTYLQDGDGVRLTGWAGELGSESCVGFGEAFGVVLPAWE